MSFSPSDPTVLLVMGLGLQMVWWRDDLVRMLVDRGLHVVRFDNRDVGRSTDPASPVRPRRVYPARPLGTGSTG